MKRCPECRRDYYDDSLLYCLDDGAALLEGPASVEEPATAILSEPPASAGGQLGSESATRLQIPTTTAEGELQSDFGRPSEKPSSSANRAAKLLVAAGLGLVLLVAGFFGYRYFSTASSKQVESIAVMPFVNESGNAEVEYLADGMTDALIASLSQLAGLNVKGHSTVFRYKGKDTSPRTIGRELNVQAVLNGRVIERGDQLILNLELLDAESENVIWADRYERRSIDILKLQSEVARDVSTKLKARLSGAEEQKISKTYTASPEAYQLYLKGNFYASQYTKDGLAKGIDYYNQAIDRDPNFALAYNGLAYYYIVALDWFMSPKDSGPKIRENARRALAIDDSLAEAHTSLAVAYSWYDWDFEAGEREFRRAIELNPNEPRTRQYYSWTLGMLGRHNEAIEQGRIAVRLDPLSAEVNTFFGSALFLARKNNDAIQQLQKTVALDQSYWLGHTFLGRAYQQAGDLQKAISEYQRALEIEPKVAEALALLGQAYALSGKKVETQEVIAQLKELSKSTYVSPYNLSIIYTAMDDKDQAFATLERAANERSVYMAWLLVDPQLYPLRSDPRFGDLVRRVGLPTS